MSVQTSSAPVVAKLSTLDRFLPVWILVAMAVGLLAGREIPGLGPALDSVSVAGASLPIALGLLVMMYPVLAKVRYDRLDTVRGVRLAFLRGGSLHTALASALTHSRSPRPF